MIPEHKKPSRWAPQPIKLKDGFYVSVKNKGIPAMMYNPTEEEMHETAARYTGMPGKEVVIMGERVNNEWVNSAKAKRGKKEKAAE